MMAGGMFLPSVGINIRHYTVSDPATLQFFFADFHYLLYNPVFRNTVMPRQQTDYWAHYYTPSSEIRSVVRFETYIQPYGIQFVSLHDTFNRPTTEVHCI